MFWNKYLLPSIVVLALVAILNWVGNWGNYYYTTNWYDWMMHFLGGAGISLFTLWIVNQKAFFKLKWLARSRNLILFIFAIGIAWEVFELVCNITNYLDIGYDWDTTHDLLMDVVGACFVAYVVNRKQKNERI